MSLSLPLEQSLLSILSFVSPWTSPGVTAVVRPNKVLRPLIFVWLEFNNSIPSNLSPDAIYLISAAELLELERSAKIPPSHPPLAIANIRRHPSQALEEICSRSLILEDTHRRTVGAEIFAPYQVVGLNQFAR
ncbi:hypothetical protein FIBSPDRAFT_884692 [Athelia psychrophila]|uniref:Uncharacterized protein n=1 Tax=Athelia psychrophila TaxID=1759441 RepID=A0A166SNG2_9AGAM|nr:hypothetical protein FIBSPDRAFT_884692 [Fibularhizoctonia sp. CBS 109695]